MNDDLNLLITFLSTDEQLVKVAICIPHGMNHSNKDWRNYEYFGEPRIALLLQNAMPPHVKSFCNLILAVEHLFYIGEYK